MNHKILRNILKIEITTFLLIFLEIVGVSKIVANDIGTSLTLLSIHTKSGNLALREKYPRRIDQKGKYVVTPGAEVYYQRSFKSNPLKTDYIRAALGAGYDCADLKSGYFHFGGRWVFSLNESFELDLGLGPTLYFRESWSKRFQNLVSDEEGFWIESDDFLAGYQHKWLIGGNVELLYKITPKMNVFWGVVPAFVIVFVNSFGVRYSF